MKNKQEELTWSTYLKRLRGLQARLSGYGSQLDGFLGLFGRRNDSRVVVLANGAIEIDGLPLAEVEASVLAYESSARLVRFFHRFVRPFYPIKKRSALLLYARSKLLVAEVSTLQQQPPMVTLNKYHAQFHALSQQTRRLSAWSSLRDFGRLLGKFVQFLEIIFLAWF